MVEFLGGSATDVGRVRSANQDSHLVAPPVFVVADGMGGHQGGEVASGIVVEEFARLAAEGYDPYQAPAVVGMVLERAFARVHEYGATHAEPSFYAGTTVVAALPCADAEGEKWLLVNLGDSRIYRMLDGELEQVSVDHSVVQELIDAGAIDREAAAEHPERHVITRALGSGGLGRPDFYVLPFSSAPRLLLCSDGVSGMVSDGAIAGVLRSQRDPERAARQVVAGAVEAGGLDNATAIVIDVVGWPSDAGAAPAAPVSLEDKLGALP